MNFILTNTSLTGLGTDALAGIEVVSLFGGPTGQVIDASSFSGSTFVAAGGGTDRVTGGSGRDVLFGDGGKDRLAGRGGRDILIGGPQADRLLGERGETVWAAQVGTIASSGALTGTNWMEGRGGTSASGDPARTLSRPASSPDKRLLRRYWDN